MLADPQYRVVIHGVPKVEMDPLKANWDMGDTIRRLKKYNSKLKAVRISTLMRKVRNLDALI
jgi:hypothetical protein